MINKQIVNVATKLPNLQYNISVNAPQEAGNSPYALCATIDNLLQ